MSNAAQTAEQFAARIAAEKAKMVAANKAHAEMISAYMAKPGIAKNGAAQAQAEYQSSPAPAVPASDNSAELAKIDAHRAAAANMEKTIAG